MSDQSWTVGIYDNNAHKFRTHLWTEDISEAQKSEYGKLNKKAFKLVSKNFPVIFIQQEDDDLPLTIGAFLGCSIFKEVWPQMGLYCYFGIQKSLLEQIESIGYQSITHYASLLHDFWLDSENVFHVDFEKNYMHIYGKSQGQFQFYNKMYFANETDVHYNLAFVEKKVWQHQPTPGIVFSGEVAIDSKIIKTLSSYYADFRFINDKSKDLVINDEIVDATNFDMYLISVCG